MRPGAADGNTLWFRVILRAAARRIRERRAGGCFAALSMTIGVGGDPMDDVLEQLGTWHQQGRDVAMATVVKTSGSTPRREGAKLIVSEDGQLAGSVSGG